jgi:ferritin
MENLDQRKLQNSLDPSIEKALNTQLKIEAMASQTYLTFASFIQCEGYEGIAEFLYTHSNEEREHMLKILRYINERGGQAEICALQKPDIKQYQDKFENSNSSFENLNCIFCTALEEEISVSKSINDLMKLAFEKSDFITFDFLSWYAKEQREEEDLTRRVLDKLNLIKKNPAGIYLFDLEIKKFHDK